MQQHQMQQMVDDILDDAVALCMHPYGNYVVQHLLGHAGPDRQARLVRLLVQNLNLLSADCYARGVLVKALSHGTHHSELAQAILSQKGLLTTMSGNRQGQLVAKLVLQGPVLGQGASRG